MSAARISTPKLRCKKCFLYILTHIYSKLQKVRDRENGKSYLIGNCPGCTTPFRQNLFEVEVINRRPLTGVGSSVKLFQPIDNMIRGE